MESINRGGLVKPSDLVFITCLHASYLYQYIRDEKLYKEFLNSVNPRSLFIEMFIVKIEEVEETNSILTVSCRIGHVFIPYVRKIATTMFNMYAKNLTAEFNDEIHKGRKRNVEGKEKRDNSYMKSRKLQSS